MPTFLETIQTQRSYSAEISAVLPDTPAARAGVAAGWQLVQVNGQPIPDILAYRRELQYGDASLLCRDLTGQEHSFDVSWEDPGLEFSEVIFDGIRKCANKCDFCYVHQMPQGFRKSLYIMDDDYRTSFLYGSFVTMTNLSDADVQRILDEHLSPLYVSVHTANQDLRADMMKWWKSKVRDPNAVKIRDMLERLAPIDLYTQMVLLPERNDGEYFDETVAYLASLDNVQAIACVPVGLTEHRKNLPDLAPYTPEQATDVLRRAHKWQEKFLAERGTRFIFPSDEFYICAGWELPEDKAYEGYEMLENGVGMVRDFLSAPLPELPTALPIPKKVILGTGKLFAPILDAAVEPLRAIENLEIEVRMLKNRTFGEVTTVAGLLAGRDFLLQIKASEADLLLVSPNVLKYGTETMLDERTLDDLRRELCMDVQVGGSNIAELAETILTGTYQGYVPQFGFSTHALKEAAQQH